MLPTQSNDTTNEAAIDAALMQAPGMERNVLGIFLAQPGPAKAIGLPLLTPEDFAGPKARTIFSAIRGVIESGAEADTAAVTHLLMKAGHMAAVGGPLTLAELAIKAPSIANLEAYCRILNEYRVRRQLFGMAHGILKSLQQDGDVFNLLANSEATHEAIQTSFTRTTLTTLKMVAAETFAYLADRHQNPGVARVQFGIPSLDKLVGGLEPGDAVVVAGRPGCGKSDVMIHIARHNALDNGLPGCIFSLEMTKVQLGFRFLSDPSGVPANAMRAVVDSNQVYAVAKAVENLTNADLVYLDDQPNHTVTSIRAYVKQAKAQLALRGLTLRWVAVDYLQLAKGSGKGTKMDDLDDVSRGLKVLAKEEEVVMFELAQLSRAVESRNPPVPIISDLRASGQIEQDADLIVFPYRPSYYGLLTDSEGAPVPGPDCCEFIAAKNRNNAPNRAMTRYLPQRSRFISYDEPETTAEVYVTPGRSFGSNQLPPSDFDNQPVEPGF